MFGHRVYQQFYADSGTGRSFLCVLSVKTGKTLIKLPGEYSLQALPKGRDSNRVQNMYNPG